MLRGSDGVRLEACLCVDGCVGGIGGRCLRYIHLLHIVTRRYLNS